MLLLRTLLAELFSLSSLLHRYLILLAFVLFSLLNLKFHTSHLLLDGFLFVGLVRLQNIFSNILINLSASVKLVAGKLLIGIHLSELIGQIWRARRLLHLIIEVVELSLSLLFLLSSE